MTIPIFRALATRLALFGFASVVASGNPCLAEELLAGLTCDTKRNPVCRLQIAPGLVLESTKSDFTIDADGLGFQYDDGNQKVTARLCAPPAKQPCFESFRGTMYAAVPKIGFFAKAVTLKPPLTSVGLDTGANLINDLALAPDLERMIDPNQKYFFFFDEQSGLSARFPGIPNLALDAGSQQTVMLFSESWELGDALVYVEAEIPGFPADGKKPKKRREGKQDSDESNQQPSNPAGGPMAVALATGGTAPFTPEYTKGVESLLQAFDGHLYWRGTIPLNPLVVLNGTLVADLDPDRDRDHPFESRFYESPDLAIGGNGVVNVQFPFVQIEGLDLTLSQASAAARVTKTETGVALSGIATSENFLAELPIPIRPDGTVESWGYISAQAPQRSYLHAAGNMNTDLSGLGKLIGVQLGTLSSQSASLDISAAGIRLIGTTESRVNPDIAWSGGVTQEVYVARGGRQSYAELRGDMLIAGQGLERAALRIDRRGMRVRGTLETALYSFPMEGGWTKNGYSISGRVQLADPLELNAQETARAADDLLQKEKARDALKSALDSAANDVASVKKPVADARKDTDAARAEVNRLAVVVSKADKAASDALSQLNSWKNKKCGLFDVVCAAKKAANVTKYGAIYAGKISERDIVRASKAVADTVLEGTLKVLRPLETNLANAESALRLAQSRLDAAAAQVRNAREYLDSLPSINGKLTPTVTLTLANGKSSGSVSALFNGRQITNGRVELGNPGKACLSLPVRGAPEVCAPL